MVGSMGVNSEINTPVVQLAIETVQVWILGEKRKVDCQIDE